MPDETDRKLFDKRVAQRYIRKGRLDDKDYEKYLKALPDLADQAVPVESDLDRDDLDDELEDEGESPAPAAAPQAATPEGDKLP